MTWFRVSDEETDGVVYTFNGQVRAINGDHPAFDSILEALQDNDYEEADAYFDFGSKVDNVFEQVSTRVSRRGDVLYFDNEPVEGVLADHVMRSIREGLDDHMPYVKFWERVASNPNEHSRKHLLKWLMNEDFSITPEGLIIGYKGVTHDLKSVRSGPGVVNGESFDGQLDNSIGNVVEVARSYVTFNPSNGCAQGLHVGTWGYASSFGSRTVEVHVDPADVVSVPTDCGWSKMRVCKYTVIAEVSEKHSLGVIA